ncbi:MAG: GAF domain-containing sensor histidine kinase [Phormidesmis sp.]
MTYGTSKPTEHSSADNIPQTRLSCLLEGRSPAQRERDRIQALAHYKLLGTDAIPIFDEATQTVSRLLAMPICLLSVVDADTQRFKSVVGLSSLGLMNQLATARSIPRAESFCTHVIDSGKTFALADATAHPAFSRSLLVQQYGIQAYLGVPLITTEGCCIGTLAIMDLLPHQFTQQEIAFLELSALWCMSEFEKQQAITALTKAVHSPQSVANALTTDSLLSRIDCVRSDLVVQLTQDLRSPLTSIAGLANMLSREIYGPLSKKQQEYTQIVHSSSQRLLSMVDEIVEIGDLDEVNYQLDLASVDIEMIGQQILAALEEVIKQKDLKIKLTVEPGSRIWNLDKRVVKQLIYHLVLSIVKMSSAGSTVRLHISRKDNNISIALWVSNPWLGEDLPQALIAWEQSNFSTTTTTSQPAFASEGARAIAKTPPVSVDTHSPNGFVQSESAEIFEALATAKKVDASRQELSLLWSHHLIKKHGGEAIIQGSPTTGYRYIITLPSLASLR